MSKYTTEVRFICEAAAGLNASEGVSKVDSIIAKAAPVIFDFDFPIFEESYRPLLEQRILQHFYTREIGFETVALWKLKLETKMNDIMPFYNQLYESAMLKYNPLHDIDYTREHNTDTAFESHQTDDSKRVDTVDTAKSNNDINKYSATPQGTLSNLEDGTYLTEATINDNTEINKGTNNSDTTSVGNKTGTNNEKFIEHITGHNGGKSTAELLMEYRKTLINIDMKVMRELEDLFMLLW